MPAECCHSAVTGVTSYYGIAMIVQQIQTGNCQLIEKGDKIKPKSPPLPPLPLPPLPSPLAASRLLPPPNITPVSAISPPVVAAPPRPRAPLKIVNHNRRRRRIIMPCDSFRSPLTGAPRRDGSGGGGGDFGLISSPFSIN